MHLAHGLEMKGTMLASVVISNYNYAPFLRRAIDSALQQTYARTEVVVVDDGSTDHSRSIIAGYGDRIVPVYQENAGQGAALNAGFAACHGDVICFLDADDAFLPRKVERVMEEWRRAPASFLLYHQLVHIDGDDRVIGKPWPRSVLRGDIRTAMARSGGWWPCPTTSGLCFSRACLERILPMPAEPYTICADAYLVGLAPFLGPVAGIREPLAFYRKHGANHHNSGTRKSEEYRRRLDRLILETTQLQSLLQARFPEAFPISLDDNFRYHQLRWLSGAPTSKLKVLAATARAPALPPSMKARELIRITLNWL